MSFQPEAYIDFEVYEDSVNYIGVAQATLPDINYLTQQITGAGIAGTIEAVLTGMVDVMTLQLTFRSSMGAAASLLRPEKHTIDLRVAEQNWDTVNTQKNVQADKYVMVVVPKGFKPGTVAPATTPDTTGEYSVYYYAGYKDGEMIWEIDPFNYICTIDGVDYMEPVRQALGK